MGFEFENNIQITFILPKMALRLANKTKTCLCCDFLLCLNLKQKVCYDFLLFGPESVGLPDEIISSYKTITIPMKENSRSINLANSVGIVVFESLRQASVQ